MRQFNTEAIILRRTNYGEADRILTLLTPDYGQLSVIAKGVRKPKSKLAGGLELFAVSDVSVIKGRGDMGTVTGARMRHFFKPILHDYDRTELGYTCIKHLYHATQTVSEPAFYHLLKLAFTCLEDESLPLQTIELWFRLQTLALLGQGLNTDTDTAGQPLRPDATYHFDFGELAFYEAAGGRFGVGHIKLLRLAAQKPPQIVSRVSGTEGLLEDCIWLVRTVDTN